MIRRILYTVLSILLMLSQGNQDIEERQEAMDVPVLVADYAYDQDLIDIVSEQAEKGQGNAGRFIIPEFDFGVPLYYYEDYDGNLQEVVDAWDSALLVPDRETPTIADHCNQGFDIIKECYEGQLCCIVNGEDLVWYECVLIDWNGINDGWLWTSTGEDVDEYGDRFLVTYTCNSHWTSITIVIWEQIEG